MNAICVVVDRLHAGYLGCYGNGWIRTPAVDRLACECCLFDQAMIDTPDLARLYRSYWQGRHAMTRNGDAEPALLHRLVENGVATALITDEPAVTAHALSAAFGEVVRLPVEGATVPALDASETQTARLYASAADWLSAARPPFMLWVHSQGMGAPWDAPLACRSYGDEEIAAYESAQVPGRPIPPNADPDELLAVRWAYADQVSHFDARLGLFLESWRSQPWAGDTLLLLTSARGLPLGEHGWVGLLRDAAGAPSNDVWYDENRHCLYGELVHVPLLIRHPRAGALTRSQAIVQPADMAATLADWWELPSLPPASGSAAWQGRSLLPLVCERPPTLTVHTAFRDHACVETPGEAAVLTPAWHLRCPREGGPQTSNEAPDLYVKPDDRWEVNNVADRCPAIVESLRQALGDFATAAANSLPDLPPLEAALVTGE